MKSRVATDIKPRVIIVGQRLLLCRKHEVRALFITRKLLMSANFRRGKSYVAPSWTRGLLRELFIVLASIWIYRSIPKSWIIIILITTLTR